ncbi:MAG: hypothetical protein U9532_03125 ['Conium maculatum' witches'-broom phytoplasma]|nr:hypothetical protein ['Conium maculatum' witches'-broom phytoplasma]
MSLYNKVVEQLRQAGFDVELTSKETNSFLHDIRFPEASIYHIAFVDEGYELKQGEKIKKDEKCLEKNILIPLYKTNKYILLSKNIYNQNQTNIDKLKNKEFNLSDIKK